MLNTPLSNVRMELLKLYSTDLKENDLKELKGILSKYFANKAVQGANRVWDEKKYSDDKMDKWLNENILNIVLDTSVLLVSVSSKSKYHWIFKNLINGVFNESITNIILMEYEEIISSRFNRSISQNVVRALIMLPNVHKVNVYDKWNMIPNDPDDNKFVDCAIAANSNYIISNDCDFSILKNIEFPQLDVIPVAYFEKTINRLI